MEPNNKSNKGLGIGIAIAAIVAVIAVAVFGSKKDDAVVPDTTSTAPTEETTTPVTPISTGGGTTTTTASMYKDGTYSATGSYMSPGGMDQLGVTVTLKGDKITDVTVTPKAGDNTSARYQQMFIDGYKTYVVGKNISSVHLDKVSGSSLTPIGFNDAIAKIEAQAKA